MSALRLIAPAKVNLSLEVLASRDDGYHEVRTVFQAIDLSDELEFEPAGDISLTVEPDGAAPVDTNLVLTAAHALRDCLGTSQGARISLTKGIPVSAGLGGGSSDAASTLLGLSQLWGAKLGDRRMAALAAGLGSDTVFFLRGGAALGSGRGERVEELPLPVESVALILEGTDTLPDPKTAYMYGLLRPLHHRPDAPATSRVTRRLRMGKPVTDVLYNAFDSVAVQAYPHYETQRQMFLSVGAKGIHLAGSGPSLFALFDNLTEATTVRDLLLVQGYVAHLAKLLPKWSADGLPA